MDGPTSARGIRCGSFPKQDGDRNATKGQGRTVFVDVKGSYVASDKALVGMLGVEDLVVVVTEDAVLVTHRSRANDLKP